MLLDGLIGLHVVTLRNSNPKSLAAGITRARAKPSTAVPTAPPHAAASLLRPRFMQFDAFLHI